MGKVSQAFQLFGSVDGAKFRTLGDVESSRLRMVLVAETVQVRLHQFRGKFTVRSSNRANLTTCHFHRRATLIDIDMSSFRTKDRMIRAGHQLQCYHIAACSVEYKQRDTVRGEGFFNLLYGFFRPFVIAIS